MSLGTTLNLSIDCATDVDTNLAGFDLRAADINHSEYSLAGLTLPNEKVISVSHQTGKSGELRHLVRVDYTLTDSALVPATASVYMVIVRPPSTAITNAILLNMVNVLVDLLIEGGANANVTKILNKEV